MNHKDPHEIIGKEVKSADGSDYGYRVLSYDDATENYTVQAICWSTRHRADDMTRTIDKFKITYRFDLSSQRRRPMNRTILLLDFSPPKPDEPPVRIIAAFHDMEDAANYAMDEMNESLDIAAMSLEEAEAHGYIPCHF